MNEKIHVVNENTALIVAKQCLLTFRNAWDARASLEAELVAARAEEGSDEKAS